MFRCSILGKIFSMILKEIAISQHRYRFKTVVWAAALLSNGEWTENGTANEICYGIKHTNKQKNFSINAFLLLFSVECYVVRTIRTEYILNAIIHCFGESSNMFAALNGIVHTHSKSTESTRYVYTNDGTKTTNNSAHFSIFVRNFYLWYHLSAITTEKGYLYTNSRIIIWIIPPKKNKKIKTNIICDRCWSYSSVWCMYWQIKFRLLLMLMLMKSYEMLFLCTLLPFHFAWNGTKRIFIDLVFNWQENCQRLCLVHLPTFLLLASQTRWPIRFYLINQLITATKSHAAIDNGIHKRATAKLESAEADKISNHKLLYMEAVCKYTKYTCQLLQAIRWTLYKNICVWLLIESARRL